MAKLNQMIAVRKGLVSRTNRAVTEIYKQFQKPALYAGISRTYQPRDDEGEGLPGEASRVQREVEADLQETAALVGKLIDAEFTIDVANTNAGADVVVDGVTFVAGAPVPFLLFLGKQLEDLRTQISKAPTLDPDKVWRPDPNVGGARTEPILTTRTAKKPQRFVKAEATDKHPAQVDVFMQDVIVGDWTTTVYSGAISRARRDQILTRINTLDDAVKRAVEEANGIDVPQEEVSSEIFEFLFTP